MAGKMMGNSSSESSVAVTISSFALFDFDKDLNFTSVKKMEKPTSVTTIQKSNNFSISNFNFNKFLSFHRIFVLPLAFSNSA